MIKIFLAAVIVAALALWLTDGPLLQASAGFVPRLPSAATPTRAPTPAPGEAMPPSGTPVGPPRGVPAPYLISVPSLNGKVLHWTQTLYSYRPDGRDPSNGKTIQTEVWLALGPDGVGREAHAINTYADGTFHQEVVDDSRQSMVVLGKDYPPSPAGCVMRGVDPAGPVALPPSFVDEALLAKSGFAKRGGLTRQLPTTAPLDGASPLRTYVQGATVHGWEKREQEASGTSRLTRFEIGADGRVVFSRVRLTDRDGVVLSESWRAYGSLDVYDPSTIPDRVFSLSQAGRNACPDAR